MCLAVPMEVKRVEDEVADVEIGGVRRQVRLDLLEEKPGEGEFVIVHAGFAIQTLSREDAMESIRIFQEGWNLELL